MSDRSAVFIFDRASAGATVPATFSALAEACKQAGLATRLIIVQSAPAPVDVSGFDTVESIAAPADMGDGASVIDGLIVAALGGSVPEVVIAETTLASRNWGARLAGRLDASFVPACDEIKADGSALRVVTTVMGGTVEKSFLVQGRRAVLLYDGDDLIAAATVATATPSALSATAPAFARLVSRDPLPDTGGLPLQGATCVVSGGLGIGSAEAWTEFEAFARKAGAAVGASRAAVDMGWAPSTRQVGFSGKKVAPDVYVAVGISGAVHHLAGIGGARKIVAVNSDPEANIFRVADVAIVGDWKEILSAARRRLGDD